MQTNEQRFHRPIGEGHSPALKHSGVPLMSHFVSHDVVDEYQGHREHSAHRAENISQPFSRFKNFNWQFLAFWTAYAAVIFAVGYALI